MGHLARSGQGVVAARLTQAGSRDQVLHLAGRAEAPLWAGLGAVALQAKEPGRAQRTVGVTEARRHPAAGARPRRFRLL